MIFRPSSKRRIELMKFSTGYGLCSQKLGNKAESMKFYRAVILRLSGYGVPNSELDRLDTACVVKNRLRGPIFGNLTQT